MGASAAVAAFWGAGIHQPLIVAEVSGMGMLRVWWSSW